MSLSNEITSNGSNNNESLYSRTVNFHKQHHLGTILKSVSILCIVLGILGLTLALALGGGLFGPWVIASIAGILVGFGLLIPSVIFLRTFVNKGELQDLAVHSRSRILASNFIKKSQEDLEIQEFFQDIKRDPNNPDSEEFMTQLSYSLFLLSDLGIFLRFKDHKGVLDIPKVLNFLNSLSAADFMRLLLTPEFVKAFSISVGNINYKPLISLLLTKVSSLSDQEKEEEGLHILGNRLMDAYGPLIIGNNHLLEIVMSCNSELNSRIGPLGSVWDYIVSRGNINLLTKILSNKKILLNCDASGNTVLTSLIDKGKWDLIPFVLRNGGDEVLSQPNRLKIDPLKLLLENAQLFPNDEEQIINTILELHHFEREDKQLNKEGLLELVEKEKMSDAIKNTLLAIGC